MAPSLPHSLPEEAIVSDIRVYGADWCGLTRRLREYLTNARFDYEYFDIDRDAIAQQFVRAVNDGRRRFPLVVVAQQVVLQPTIAVLRRVLSDLAISPRSRQPYPRSARAE
jgi:glutaredoxin